MFSSRLTKLILDSNGLIVTLFTKQQSLPMIGMIKLTRRLDLIYLRINLSLPLRIMVNKITTLFSNQRKIRMVIWFIRLNLSDKIIPLLLTSEITFRLFTLLYMIFYNIGFKVLHSTKIVLFLCRQLSLMT